MSCVVIEVKTGLKYITSLLKNQVLIVMFHQFLTFRLILTNVYK